MESLCLDQSSYKEDECWAIVAIAFPELFTRFERRCAERTIKDSWPDAWEAIFGTVLGPGESVAKDRRAFEAQHAEDWIVVAAITSSHRHAFVECVATIGGQRRTVRLSRVAAGKGAVNSSGDRVVLLHRMEEARRQTQRQLDVIHRQIRRCVTALFLRSRYRRTADRRGRSSGRYLSLGRYRAHLAVLTAERQSEIDALSTKLVRQDRAIARFRARMP